MFLDTSVQNDRHDFVFAIFMFFLYSLCAVRYISLNVDLRDGGARWNLRLRALTLFLSIASSGVHQGVWCLLSWTTLQYLL